MDNSTVDSEERNGFIIEMSANQVVQVILAGFIAGLVAGGLTLLFGTFLFKIMPCYAETCGAGGQYAAVLASIVSAAVALFWFIRIQIYRPLLVVIAVTICLWGIPLYILDWPWYAVVAISAGFHTVAYALFAWISRIRFFWAVVLLLLVVIVGVRYILAT